MASFWKVLFSFWQKMLLIWGMNIRKISNYFAEFWYLHISSISVNFHIEIIFHRRYFAFRLLPSPYSSWDQTLPHYSFSNFYFIWKIQYNWIINFFCHFTRLIRSFLTHAQTLHTFDNSLPFVHFHFWVKIDHIVSFLFKNLEAR